MADLTYHDYLKPMKRFNYLVRGITGEFVLFGVSQKNGDWWLKLVQRGTSILESELLAFCGNLLSKVRPWINR